MGPMPVVMLEVLDEDSLEVPAIEDQHPVKAFPAQGPHDALTDRVRPGRRLRGADDVDALGGEDGVEGVGELGITLPTSPTPASSPSTQATRRSPPPVGSWLTKSPSDSKTP